MNCLAIILSALAKIIAGPIRFYKDHRGVAAVEFGYIAPLMVVMYIGTVELSTALTADRRVSQLSSTTADLVAQNDTVTQDTIDAIFDISDSLLNPLEQNAFNTTNRLEMKVTSVVADEDNNTTVSWSHVYGGATADTPGEPYTLPNVNMTQPFSSVIIAEITYEYDSLFQYFIPNTLDITDTYYLRPRKSLQVTCEDCPTD